MGKLSNYLLFAALTLSASTATAADTTDSEGYPILYLRGTSNNWEARNAYKFTRVDDTYSIHLTSLNGNWKISDANWGYNWGGGYDITTSSIFKATYDSSNLNASNLSNVDIQFSFTKGVDKEGSIKVTVTVDGNEDYYRFTTTTPHEVSDVKPSGTLPILYINVTDEDGEYNDDIISRNLGDKEYRAGSYWLDLNGCQWLADLGAKSVFSEDSPGTLQIKARGNYTRTGFSKKPFKLKLDKKQDLLGLSPNKSKHYAILAHADDNYGYLRNFTGFNLGKRIGLPWTPAQQPIEVVINGDYRGIYFLTESIRVEEGRVPIQELADDATDAALISGGYLVELDNYDEDNQIRMTEKSYVGGYCDKLRVTWDTPESYSDIQKQFITDQFTTMNEYVGANNSDLWSYIDLDDAVRYYICKEIISDVEAYHGSTYLYRDRGEGQKWHFSPLWDCGNAFGGSTSGYFYNGSPFGNTWIPSMRANDAFNAKLRETWLWFMSSEFDGLYDDITTEAARTASAAVSDRQRWKDEPLPSSSDATAVCDNSDMDSARDKALNHLKSKVAWLKQQFGDPGTTVYTEPERDTTEAAPLPDYAQSGVEAISIGSNAPVEYFNLQGIRVDNPSDGIYIRRQGSKATKVIVKH